MDKDGYITPWVPGTTNPFPLNGRFRHELTREDHLFKQRRSAESRARLVRSTSPDRNGEAEIHSILDSRLHPKKGSFRNHQEGLPPATEIQKALWKAEVAKVDFQGRTYPEGLRPGIPFFEFLTASPSSNNKNKNHNGWCLKLRIPPTLVVNGAEHTLYITDEHGFVKRYDNVQFQDWFQIMLGPLATEAIILKKPNGGNGTTIAPLGSDLYR
eukprot:1175561-Prorocentrum_minimum.AAC.5